MKTKPEILIAAGALLVLFVVIGLLKNSSHHDAVRANQPRAGTTNEAGAVRSPFTTRIGRVLSSGPEPASAPTPPKVNRLTPHDRAEDFRALKVRAFGESAIYGIVRSNNGKPLPGATVQLYEFDPMTKNPPLREVTCDEQGSYTLTQLNDAQQRYILVARAEAHAPEAHVVHLDGEPEQRDMRLSKGVELTGEVRDAITSAPIPNAVVYFPSRTENIFGVLGQSVSGPAGQFTFPFVPPGKLRALAHAEGYHRTIAAVSAPNKNALIALRAGGGTIRGVTTSRLTQKPEGGAKVVVQTEDFRDSTMSDENGVFEFTDMPEGDYSIYAVKGMPSARQTFKLGDRETKEGIVIVLPSDLLVQGKVVHAITSTGMPGVRVFYQSSRGKQFVLTDPHGQFAFETMTLSQYTMEVHEKNFLPVQDKKTTGVVETITRKISQNAASDQVIIKMRPVPAVEGNVRLPHRRNTKKTGPPGANIEVAVSYLQGKEFERVVTRTDVFGDFFVNLPSQRSGIAKVVAHKRGAVDVQSVRIPSRKSLKMLLELSPVRAQLLLVDKTPLSGVRVAARYLFPDGRPPERAIPIPGSETITQASGIMFLQAAMDQTIMLYFYLPDGQIISKAYKSELLMRKRPIFIYDPVSGDILSDVKSSSREPGKSNPNTTAQQNVTKKNQNMNKQNSVDTKNAADRNSNRQNRNRQ